MNIWGRGQTELNFVSVPWTKKSQRNWGPVGNQQNKGEMCEKGFFCSLLVRAAAFIFLLDCGLAGRQAVD